MVRRVPVEWIHNGAEKHRCRKAGGRMVGRVSGLILEREERGYGCWDILWIGVPLERTGLISSWLDGFLVCEL